MLSGQLRKLVAEWLKAGMRLRGVTAVDLAVQAGVARPTISSILNERSDTGDDTIEKLRKALDIPGPEIAGRVMEEGPTFETRKPPEGADEVGWLFGDPLEAEREVRSWLRDIDARFRTMIGGEIDDPASIRAAQLAICRSLSRQFQDSGKRVPAWLETIFDEVTAGAFR